jgi:integrase
VDLVTKSFGGTYAARDKALFILGVKSGFRISELLSLTVGDVTNMVTASTESAFDADI